MKREYNNLRVTQREILDCLRKYKQLSIEDISILTEIKYEKVRQNCMVLKREGYLTKIDKGIYEINDRGESLYE